MHDDQRARSLDDAKSPRDEFRKLDLPKDEDGRRVEAPVAQNIYRSKDDCVSRFERLMSSSDVTIPVHDGYRRDLKSDAVRSAFKVTTDLLDLYDVNYRRLPDTYNSNEGKFVRITAAKKMNTDGGSRKKYTKFSHKQVGAVILDGFVVQLVVGLKSPIKVTESGQVRWKTDPHTFLDDHFDTVVGDFKSEIALLECGPQKVVKAPEAYPMAEVAHEMVLCRTGK